MIRPLRAGLAVCCVAVLCGCGSADHIDRHSTTATSWPPPVTSPAAQPPAAASPTSTPPLVAGLVADAEAADAAKARAVAGMAAFARPDLGYEQWWAGLEPLLAGPATVAYRAVDPALIPATRVTGEASLPDWDTPRIARVGVPTDAGVYLVIVSRSEADPVWRVERITPPEAW